MRFLILTVLLSSAAAQAQVYTCTNERGNKVFSDTPCGKDATQIDLKVPASSGIEVGNEADFDQIAKENSQRSLDRRIARLEAQAENLYPEYIAERQRIEQQIRELKPNASYVRDRDALRDKKSRLTDNYNAEKKRTSETLAKLRKERAEL